MIYFKSVNFIDIFYAKTLFYIILKIILYKCNIICNIL